MGKLTRLVRDDFVIRVKPQCVEYPVLNSAKKSELSRDSNPGNSYGLVHLRWACDFSERVILVISEPQANFVPPASACFE